MAQDGEFDVIPAEKPVVTCAWGPTEVSSPENPYAPNALGPSAHVPGEFVATYESADAMWAAPQDNAKCTWNDRGSYYADMGTVYYTIRNGTQVLYLEDQASSAKQCERFAAEKAKSQEILARREVRHPATSLAILQLPSQQAPSEVSQIRYHDGAKLGLQSLWLGRRSY